MKTYLNLNGSSNITYYLIGNDFIKVQFGSNQVYTYNYTGTGKQNIEEMKSLAIRGFGLGSFITKNVKNNYSNKEKLY
jgi:hypothetical protein